MEGARAREIAERTPGSFMPQQFDNPLQSTGSRGDDRARDPPRHARASIDAFVAGVGTGGNISGIGKVLSRSQAGLNRGRRTESCATIARGERGPSKIRPGGGFVPTNYHPEVVDEVRTVTDADAWRAKSSWRVARTARRDQPGASARRGAAARELGEGKNVVTILRIRANAISVWKNTLPAHRRLCRATVAASRRSRGETGAGSR